ncbi:LCP family protein [Embleya sp. AB8]|uniref:LCP family protein n=1 Tax=Embleya sp. AB8 TaxID=3156304 RepID=UPI003C754DB1
MRSGGSESTAGARRRRRPRRTKPWAVLGRVLVCTLSIAVLLASGVTWYVYRDLTHGMQTSNALDEAKAEAPKHLDNAVNLLLIGLDSRRDMNGKDLPKKLLQDELHAGSSSEVGGYNTNTLILMHIPANGGKVTAFSIPRDDYVDIPGTGHKRKIKEAYDNAKYVAENKLAAQGVKDPVELEHKGREAGRAATLRTVQAFLGVPIDHFAEVNLLGFYDIAGALGGVEVCLNGPVKDHYSGADFPAGRQQLNASQALAFVRQRHGLPNYDLDRTHRQQAFLSSVATKLKNGGVFGDVGKMRSLLDVVKKDLVIDNSWDVLDFAQQASNLTGGNAEFFTLPIERYDQIGDQDVNIVDPVKIKAIVAGAIAHDPAISPSGAAVPPPPPPPSTTAAAGPTGSAPGATSSPSATSKRRGTQSTPPPSTVPPPPVTPVDPPSTGPQGGSVKMGGIPCVN